MDTIRSIQNRVMGRLKRELEEESSKNNDEMIRIRSDQLDLIEKLKKLKPEEKDQDIVTRTPQLYFSPAFVGTHMHLLEQQWRSQAGGILYRRLNAGFSKVGTIELGSVPYNILYDWIGRHATPPKYRVRNFKRTINGQAYLQPREYFTWKDGMPSLEPKQWWTITHQPGIKSFYSEITMIYIPSDRRIWCKYHQVTAKLIEGLPPGVEQWTRIR